MKKLLLACFLLGPAIAHAGPAEDRQALLDRYAKALPGIRFEDYVYGSLAMNPKAKSQYDDIMAFPPFSLDVDEGRQMWEKPFSNGRHFSSCFPGGGRNVAGNYPYYDEGRVVTFESAINACLEANGERKLEYGGKEMGLITAYAKSLSDGMKVDVKVEGARALAAYEKGKQYYYARRGKKNLSCGACHVEQAGELVQADRISMLVGQATHYPVFVDGTRVMTLQQRFRQCEENAGMQPAKAGSEIYDDLEYFVTYMSNGLPMEVPVFRK